MCIRDRAAVEQFREALLSLTYTDPFFAAPEDALTLTVDGERRELALPYSDVYKRQVLCERFHAAIGEPLSEDREEALRELAETTKVELSSYDRSLPTFEVGGRYVRLPVTREEFEKGSRELLQKTVEKTRRFLEKHPNQKPDFILLSGGGSEMPMVSRALSEALPDYQILSHNPSRAIAYGAARYGTTEINDDPVLTQHIKYDIGVRFYDCLLYTSYHQYGNTVCDRKIHWNCGIR